MGSGPARCRWAAPAPCAGSLGLAPALASLSPSPARAAGSVPAQAALHAGQRLPASVGSAPAARERWPIAMAGVLCNPVAMTP